MHFIKEKNGTELIPSELNFMPEWASKTLKTDLMILLNDLYPK